MNAEDKQQDQGAGNNFESSIIALMQEVYANRDAEEKWQEVLKEASDEQVSFLTDHVDLLSQVLVAESKDQIKALVDAVIAENAGEKEAATVKSEDDQVQTSQQTEEPSSGADETTVGMEASQEDRGQEEGNEVCSDDTLIAFLTKVFKVQHQDDKKLSNLLQQAGQGVVNRLDENPFYLQKVLSLTNENEFNDFIQILKENAGPEVSAEKMKEGVQEVVDPEIVDMLLDNWSYIEFNCTITNPDNEQVKSAGFLEEAMQWMSTAGVGVACVPVDEAGTITVSTSLQGALHGFDSDIEMDDADGNVDTEIYGIQESAEKRRMLLAIDLIGFLKTTEMKDVKIRSGHRELMRNVWAIGQVNDVACSGFEPTPAESVWYEKRASYFQDQFQVVLEDELTHKPGMALGGSGSTSVATESEQDVDGESHEDDDVNLADPSGAADDHMKSGSGDKPIEEDAVMEQGELKEGDTDAKQGQSVGSDGAEKPQSKDES